MSDLDQVNSLIQGMLASAPNITALAAQMRQTFRRKVLPVGKPAADGAAATATTLYEVFVAPVACQVLSVKYIPNAALTADATNNATLNVKKQDGAGGAAVVAASLTTDVAGGSWTAHIAKAFANSATAANLVLAAGNTLAVEITKGGTGVVVPAGSWHIDYEEL